MKIMVFYAFYEIVSRVCFFGVLLSVNVLFPMIMIFTLAFRYWKCYYSPCFEESDSWDMIFDIGGSRKIAAIGLERGRFLVDWLR